VLKSPLWATKILVLLFFGGEHPNLAVQIQNCWCRLMMSTKKKAKSPAGARDPNSPQPLQWLRAWPQPAAPGLFGMVTPPWFRREAGRYSLCSI